MKAWSDADSIHMMNSVPHVVLLIIFGPKIISVPLDFQNVKKIALRWQHDLIFIRYVIHNFGYSNFLEKYPYYGLFLYMRIMIKLAELFMSWNTVCTRVTVVSMPCMGCVHIMKMGVMNSIVCVEIKSFIKLYIIFTPTQIENFHGNAYDFYQIITVVFFIVRNYLDLCTV